MSPQLHQSSGAAADARADAVHVDPPRLRQLAARLLEAAGLLRAEAGLIADHLLAANLRGVDSHGVVRVPQYADSIRRGDVNARPRVREAHARGATAGIDADGGYGFGPTVLAVDRAVELASAHGVGAVSVANSHHFGMAATYAERVADAGMIGIVTTTADPVLGPPGARRPVVGNNPLACSVPRAEARPLVLDFALSTAALGKIRLAAAEGRGIPEGWAYDSQGRPTQSASEALSAQFLRPIGDHKGYGLAVMGAVLAGIMTGSPAGSDARAHERSAGGVGHLVLVLDPEAFLPRDRFHAALEGFVRDLAETSGAAAEGRVALPGEVELRTLDRRTRDGIPVAPAVLRDLNALAMRFGVPPLEQDA